MACSSPTPIDLQPTDALDALNAASIRYRIALGPGAGGRNRTLKNPALVRSAHTPKPFKTDRDGFLLNAALSCQPRWVRAVFGFSSDDLLGCQRNR